VKIHTVKKGYAVKHVAVYNSAATTCAVETSCSWISHVKTFKNQPWSLHISSPVKRYL